MNTQQLTTLTYLDEGSSNNGRSKVTAMITREDGRIDLQLESTIFYPQGGGQPYDTGTIEGNNSQFLVEETRFENGIVQHIGRYSEGNFSENEEVDLRVNPERRMLNSRLHSAGHLLDIAMSELGYNYEPGRGYHFPEGSYVEYFGTIEPDIREEVKEKLSATCNQLIQQGLPITSQLIEQDHLKEHCAFVPDYIPQDKVSRVVFIGNYPGCPCGGTHTKDLKDIGTLTVYKIKGKGDRTRVSYSLT